MLSPELFIICNFIDVFNAPNKLMRMTYVFRFTLALKIHERGWAKQNTFENKLVFGTEKKCMMDSWWWWLTASTSFGKWQWFIDAFADTTYGVRRKWKRIEGRSLNMHTRQNAFVDNTSCIDSVSANKIGKVSDWCAQKTWHIKWIN